MRRKYFLGILLFGLLAACGTAPAKGVDNAAATKIVATFMAQITQTAAAITPAAPIATETEHPAATETPLVSPTPDSMIQLLGRFRTVTVSQGNLFVRDGTGLPVQITKSGKDHDPIISADGQKIVFYRGEEFNNDLFVVNADGSGEKALITKTTLSAKTKNRITFPTFRPGASQLIFSTYMCEDPKCAERIFLVETESSAITAFATLSSTQRYFDNTVFSVSPDGQHMVVKSSDQLDLYSMDGKVVQANIVSGASHVYWFPDSSGLIAWGTGFGSYSIWRYILKDQHVEKISLNPAPAFDKNDICSLSVSPDRNWILYQDHNQKEQLANLKNAEAQVYDWDDTCSVFWAPDSQHFASQTAIRSVDGTLPIIIDGHFIAWVDATHYLFTKGKGILDLQTYIAEVGKESAAVSTNFIWSPVYAVLP